MRITALLIGILTAVAPSSSHAQLPWLHQEDVYWKDDQGNKVELKGVNLGNWLILEMWMTSIFENVSDQCDLENQLTARFGYAGKESIMKTWRDHWITTRDLDLIQAFGFNCIRVPFLYSIIEDENNPYTVRPDAWDHLDWVIDEAEARGIYTILDLHGAVGGQSNFDHTGCANQNLLWTTASYLDRTEWLWEQVATRYANRSAVAAYDLLNEAWGTDCNTMASFQIDLYNAVRPIDPDHVIILSAAISCGGIDMYGDPQDDHGMTNVAFTHHFYPGFFGNGDATVATHADWLACLSGSTSGVCEWTSKMVNTGTAFLVGEFQPWAIMGDVGGKLARHTYDRYAELGMASTAWSYKLLSIDGGQGDGSWGTVINYGGQPTVSGTTWLCPGWDSTFADACGAHTVHYTAPGTGTKTVYVALKNGALNTNTFNVVWDNISLVHDDTQQELLNNGGFGSSTGWSEYHHIHPVHHVYNYASQTPTGGSGSALLMWGTASGSNIANGGVYQPVTVTGGEHYTLSGVFRDIGSSDTWAEIFIVEDPPVDGIDLVNPYRLQTIDINVWAQFQIESYLQTLSTMEYDIHDDLLYWMTTSEKPCLIPEICEPDCGDGTCGPSEDACTCPQDCATPACPPAQPFFGAAQPIPGLIEAENYDLGGEGDAYHDCDPGNQGVTYRPFEGVDLQPCSEGGFNIGWICENEWVDFNVDVMQAGTYQVDVRVASQDTGGQFHIEFDYVNATGDILVPSTGGWQTWTTVTGTAQLSAGVQTMRFVHGGLPGQEYNLNWFEFTLVPAVGDIDLDGDIDLTDLALFVDVLLGNDVDAGRVQRSDIDASGTPDGNDIEPFTEAMLGN